MTRLAHLLLAATLLGGCTLVDQRTFQRSAAAPGTGEIARTRAPELPLLTIRMGGLAIGEPTSRTMDQAMDRGLDLTGDQAGINLGSSVAEAVRSAEARKPDVVFDILALVPTEAAAAEQTRRITQASADAATVATAFAAAGVPSERLRLVLRGDPGSPAREVRVYVR